ncbi:hypothetical protein CRUP_027561, partial [Coryphaenoides rupestris]
VPEIISTLRQAGKSAARSDDVTPAANEPPPAAHRSLTAAQSCPAFPSMSTATATLTTTTAATASCASLSAPPLSPTAFTKKFEVLFCGRVTVAHKKAPPDLIDECIEKFGQSRGSGGGDGGGGPAAAASGAKGGGGRGPAAAGGPRKTLAGGDGGGGDGLAESPTMARRLLTFKRDPSFPCLQALDENGLSPEITLSHADDTHRHSTGVRPTSLQENRTMLFMVGRSQVFLVSPDTKKVDEIMLTLKQAFSVAAQQQSVRTQSQQCDSCPMQQLHRLATSEQEENELVMASLRRLYEERQKDHQHTGPSGDRKQTSEQPTPAEVQQQQQSSSRQRLEEFKTRAKRSLTESLEGIWKAGRKPVQRQNSEGSDGGSSSSTLRLTPEQSSIEDPPRTPSPLRSTSSLRGHNSTGDLKCLDPWPPSASSPLSLSGGAQQQQNQQGFRRRASTYSHPPTPTSSSLDPSPTHTHPLAPQDLAQVCKPKLVRHYSVSTDTPHQS